MKTFRAIFLSCLAISAFALFGTAAAETGKAYKFAIDGEYAPYEFVTPDGGVSGFAPDLRKITGA